MRYKFCKDKFWNTTYTLDQNHPEFTNCFQYSFLLIPPCYFVLIVFIFYLLSGFVKPKKIMKLNVDFWYSLKLFFQAFIGFLYLLEVFIDIFILDGHDILEPISFCVNAVNIILVIALTEYRRRKFHPICPILFSYWFLMLLCYTLRFYSNIFRFVNSEFPYNTVVGYLMMSGITLVLIFISFLYECVSRFVPARSMIKRSEPCPEEYASILSKLTYSWMDKYIYRWYRIDMNESNIFDLRREEECYKNTKLIERVFMDKLTNKSNHEIQKSFLSNTYTSTETTDHDSDMSPLLMKEPEKDFPNVSNFILISTLWKVFHRDILCAWLSKLIHDCMIFVSPFLLKIMIGYVSNKSSPSWQGYCLAVGFFIFGAISAITENMCFFINSSVSIRIRSSLIGVIYRKSLKISNEVRNKYTTGEIVNYMSVDAERVLSCAMLSWFILSSPLEIIICLIFLYSQLGYSVFAGLALIVLFFPVNGLVMSLDKKFTELELKWKDKRTKILSEIFKGIKILKMYAWENSFVEKISGYRHEEVRYVRNASMAWGVVSILWDILPFFVMFITFLVYVYTGDSNVITPEKAFVSLALFSLLKFPMTILPYGIIDTVNAYVSVKRITKFLLSKEIDITGIIHIEDTYVDHKPKDKIVVIENGSFAWQNNDKLILNNVNLEVNRGKLIAVVGKIGVGKSSLLSAILGEMIRVDGLVTVRGTIGYVSQEAWIQNQTVRENIVFTGHYSLEEYRRVIDACALQPDLDQLAAGDDTEIGERGINLSGGQKQRISLARAVYQNKEVYLLDDPLSAVDAHVGMHLFKKVISSNPDSLLAGKTRILVTHGIHWLPKVDEIVVIGNDGTITEKGSYKELMENGAEFKNYVQEYLDKQTELTGDKDEKERAENLLRELSRKESYEKVFEELVNLGAIRKPSITKPSESTAGSVHSQRELYESKSVDICRRQMNFNSCANDDEKLGGSLEINESSNVRLTSNNQMYTIYHPNTSMEAGVSPTSLWKAAFLESSGSEKGEKKCKKKEIQDEVIEEIDDEDVQSTRQDDRISNQSNNQNISSIVSVDNAEIGAKDSLLDKTIIKNLGQLIDDEEAMSGKVKASTYWMYFMTWSPILFLGFLLFFGIFVSLQVFGNMWLERMTSDSGILNASKEIELNHSTATYYEPIIRSRMNYYMLYYMLIGLGQLASVVSVWFCIVIGIVRASRLLHSKLLYRVLRSPLSFFDTTPSGRILNRFSRDMDTLDHTIPYNLTDSFACGLTVIASIIVIIIVTPWFGIVILPLAIIYYIIQHFYIPTTRQARRLSSIAASPIFNHFSETLQGSSIIRAFCEQKKFERINRELVDRSSNFLFIQYGSTRWLALRLDLLGAFLIFFAVVFAVADREVLGASLIGLSIAYALTITDNLNWTVRQYTELETNAVAIERIREYSQVKSEANWDYEDHKESGSSPPDRDWPNHGSVEFSNYSMRYRPGLPLSLKNLNFRIESGEKIGVAGRTGAGKSSLIQALLRLVDPAEQGSISIDYRNIEKPLPLHVLRRAITVLPQEPMIFSGTVQDNLDPTGEFKDRPELLEEALRRAHLGDWLLESKNRSETAQNDEERPAGGLQYECGEGGVNLSAGQRQLLCLSRALLRKSKILILDEATASVDVQTDQLVMDTIRDSFPDYTIIIIAHRINTIMDCDKILVLDRGELVEFDKPTELIKLPDGYFNKMFIQSKTGTLDM